MYYLLFILLSFLSLNDNKNLAVIDCTSSIEISSDIFNEPIAKKFLIIQGAKMDAEFTLINKHGRLIQKGILIGNTLDVAMLEKGIYYIKTLSKHNQPFTFSFAHS